MTLLSFPLPSTTYSLSCISLLTYGSMSAQTRASSASCSCSGARAEGLFHFEEKRGRRLFLAFLAGSGALSAASPSFGKTKKQSPYDERRLLEQNKRIQRENNVPDDFPNFVREGFTVKVVTPDYYVTCDSGLVLWDVAVGEGECPKDGQQVTFHYVGYNESGTAHTYKVLQPKFGWVLMH